MGEGAPTSAANARGGRQVFLSYTVNDRALAERVRSILARAVDTVWMAPHSIPAGKSYPDSIIKGIEQSDIVFVLVTRNSLTNINVQREVERAASKRKILISLRADDVPLTGELEFFLARVQWIEILNSDADAWADQLIAAARNPEARLPPEQRAGTVALSFNNLLVLFGAIAAISALAANWFGANLPAAAPGALLLIALVCFFGAWLRAQKGVGLRRIATVRWGDVAITLAVLLSIAAAWFWMLMTPLVTALVLALVYFGLRTRVSIAGKHLSRRGAVMAALAAIFLGFAVARAESALYDALDRTGVTLALVPQDNCPAADDCRKVPRDLYNGIYAILQDVFSGANISVFPFHAANGEEYESLIRRINTDPRARGIALINTIAGQRDVFDGVLTLRINYQTTPCNSTTPALDMEVDLANWRRGRLPALAFWESVPPSDVRWRQFEATIDLDPHNQSASLAIATISMATRVVLAAQTNTRRLGGDANYGQVVDNLLRALRSRARSVPLPASFGAEAQNNWRRALATLEATPPGTGTPLSNKVIALEQIANAYEPMLVRRTNQQCLTEVHTLLARVAPDAPALTPSAPTASPASSSSPAPGGGR